MPGGFFAYSAIIAAMGDWDIDSPVKGDSSRPQTAAPGRAASTAVSATSRSGAGTSVSPPAQAPLVPGAGGSTQAPGGKAPRKGWIGLWHAWLGIVLVLLLVGLMAGFFIGRSQYSGDGAALADAQARVGELQAALSRSEDRNWTYYRTNASLKAELTQAGSSTSTTAPSPRGAKGSYSDGVYLVGEDIPAGTYDGVVNGSAGYWARLKATDGTISSIIDNGVVKGPFVLTIDPADKALDLRGVTLTLH
jgi:hypothetical protein